MILIDVHPRHDWLLPAVEKRLREEPAALQVEINEEKSRIVDLSRGEGFGFLGFDFRRVRSERGIWRANATPDRVAPCKACGSRPPEMAADATSRISCRVHLEGERDWVRIVPWRPLRAAR